MAYSWQYCKQRCIYLCGKEIPIHGWLFVDSLFQGSVFTLINGAFKKMLAITVTAYRSASGWADLLSDTCRVLTESYPQKPIRIFCASYALFRLMDVAHFWIHPSNNCENMVIRILSIADLSNFYTKRFGNYSPHSAKFQAGEHLFDLYKTTRTHEWAQTLVWTVSKVMAPKWSVITEREKTP